MFKFIPKYILIRKSSFQENAKTKVYALEDSLGVEQHSSDYSALLPTLDHWMGSKEQNIVF